MKKQTKNCTYPPQGIKFGTVFKCKFLDNDVKYNGRIIIFKKTDGDYYGI